MAAHLRFLRHVSGGALLAAMLSAAALGALALTVGLLSAAAATDARDRAQIEDRIVLLLLENGLSDLTLRIDRRGEELLPGLEDVRLVLWQWRAGDWRLHRTTAPDIAAGFPAPPDPGREERAIGGRRYLIESPDIAALSADWLLPMADTALSLAFALPGPAVHEARRVIWAVWSGLALAVVIGLALLASHKRRYSDGIAEINALLARFSEGETDLRLPEDQPAPELGDLARHLNRVLPRIAELVGGLRYLSATMAHELKTPLQVIRSDLSRLGAAPDAAGRATYAADIDRTIDAANARLHALTQLFRLEAMAEVPMTRVDLSTLTEQAADDLADLLETRNRQLRLDIAPGVAVTGNRALLDLMLSNLLGNAAKYAPDGAGIGVTLAREGDAFALSVWNTGATFPDDIRARAFERFSRARDEGESAGTGIGLSLIRAIAQRHGFDAAIAPATDRAEVTISGDCAP